MRPTQQTPLSTFGGGFGAGCHCGSLGLGGGCGPCRGCNCFGTVWKKLWCVWN